MFTNKKNQLITDYTEKRHNNPLQKDVDNHIISSDNNVEIEKIKFQNYINQIISMEIPLEARFSITNTAISYLMTIYFNTVIRISESLLICVRNNLYPPTIDEDLDDFLIIMPNSIREVTYQYVKQRLKKSRKNPTDPIDMNIFNMIKKTVIQRFNGKYFIKYNKSIELILLITESLMKHIFSNIINTEMFSENYFNNKSNTTNIFKFNIKTINSLIALNREIEIFLFPTSVFNVNE